MGSRGLRNCYPFSNHKCEFINEQTKPFSLYNRIMSGKLPFPQSETAAIKSGMVFKLIENLNTGYGYERSFKVFDKTILANRFLLGVEKEETPPNSLLEICQQMNMPDGYQEIFKQNLPDANMVLFGFEEGEKGCVYKVYLEFWEK